MDAKLSFRQQVIDKLTDHNITATKQRVEIGLCLFDCDQHVTADQLQERVNKSGGEASKATIYNTLGLFAKKGLLREVVIDPTKLVYDTNTSTHHHIYNLDSGELQDITAGEVGLNKLPELGENLEVEDVDIIIRVRNKD
ncbi:MAG TPA: transcriptional repressor [Chromatiales bacterium]|nr:transcriptional repressor [Thiotrichales bacterium]HIP69315.1 transcriptional repressor [Chromatiales bacterium]